MVMKDLHIFVAEKKRQKNCSQHSITDGILRWFHPYIQTLLNRLYEHFRSVSKQEQFGSAIRIRKAAEKKVPCKG